MTVLAIAILLITGALAARKGYNFFCWTLAGGILGLIVLAFLPNTKLLDEEARQSKVKLGNGIGLGISAFLVLVGIFLSFPSPS